MLRGRHGFLLTKLAGMTRVLAPKAGLWSPAAVGWAVTGAEALQRQGLGRNGCARDGTLAYRLAAAALPAAAGAAAMLRQDWLLKES